MPLNRVATSSPPVNMATGVESPASKLPTAAVMIAEIAVGSIVTPSVRKMELCGAGMSKVARLPEAETKLRRAVVRTEG
jgi:hypothetical protein